MSKEENRDQLRKYLTAVYGEYLMDNGLEEDLHTVVKARMLGGLCVDRQAVDFCECLDALNARKEW